MPRLTPEEFADKHARRLKGSTEDIRAGIQRVTKAPTELAAQKKEKMKTRLVQAVDSGIWEKRLRKVSLSEWQTKTIDKGISRISGGIDAARDKVTDFARQVLPYIESGQSKIASMPDLTLEDSLARATAWIRHMAGFKKQ